MENSRREQIDNIPGEYFDSYDINLLGQDLQFFKPMKVTYNSKHTFFVYRPKLKYFIECLAENYNKKEMYAALIEGYNEGKKEYSKTFDFNSNAAKDLLTELQRLQNSELSRNISYPEMAKQGFIEGSINCLHGIIEANEKIFFKKKEPKKLVQSFESLFRDPHKAKEVKKILEIKGYTSNGLWQGISGNKTELLAAYYELRELLQNGKVAPQAKIFYKEFGLVVGKYISERSLNNEPVNDDRNEFSIIFASLFNSPK